jgi:tRNA(His) guanylyltransferase
MTVEESKAPIVEKKSVGKKSNPFGDRMKKYEEDTPAQIPNDKFLVIRADGHHFSKVTSGFQKPADGRITRAMIGCMLDLMNEFGALTAYTQSDEITLVFPPCTLPEHTHPNSGRVQKLASRVAGYTSVRFVHHLGLESFTEPNLLALATSNHIYFDARAIAFPSQIEVVNHLVWRSMYDAVRNSISGLARHHLGAKKCFNKNSGEMKAMLRAEKQRRIEEPDSNAQASKAVKHSKKTANEDTAITWEEQDSHYRYGSYAKRELYLVDATDHKTGLITGEVQRSKTTIRSFPISADEIGVAIVFAK